ncbi:MBL fold metallo-hydrolase [uncultured Tenacibaculum sp.]|uniref:MBL fold metallo-hydrolase n=1 Tax=uncultured Tenacibaculum sp. TaxID=174713 RepID=UPI0026120AD7|nr:MBL fold metallo-hydrolase [uncultured Tenacibaculum sp.]
MVKETIRYFFLISLLTNCINAQNNSFDFEVTPVTKNVYSIVSPSFGLPTPENKGWNANSHFVVTKDGVLLFDTGSSETIGNKIKNAIKTVTNKPVRWVINSHSHADHWLGNAAFSEADIFSSKEAKETMKKYGKEDLAFYNRVTKGTIGKTQLVYPTKLITKHQKMNLGGVEVEFIFSNNSHSHGDVLVWLPQQKIIFGGDVLSSSWMPIIINPKKVPDLIQTLNTIAKLKPKHVLTGHGVVTNGSTIVRDANLLSNVWQQVKEAKSNGKTKSEVLTSIETKLAPTYKDLYSNFTSEIKRYVEVLYKL